SAAAAGELDDAVACGEDRRAPGRGDVYAPVHAGIAEDRVAAHAEARGEAAVRRHRHRAGGAAAAQAVEPGRLAALLERRELHLVRTAADAGVHQASHLHFAGLGARLAD